MPLKTWKNCPQKLLIIGPQSFFFSIANRPKISPNLIFCSIKMFPCATSIQWLWVHKYEPYLYVLSTDYERPERKWPSLHCRKLNPNPKFLGMAEAYFCLPHRPNFSDFFDLCRHWVSVVRGFIYANIKCVWLFICTCIGQLWFHEIFVQKTLQSLVFRKYLIR